MPTTFTNGAVFNGTNFLRRAVVSAATNNFTMSAWVKFTGDGGVVMSNGIDNAVSAFNGVSIIVRPNDTWFAVFNGVAFFFGVTALQQNIWYHVVFVRNSGTARLYLNGVDEGVTNTTTPSTPTGYTTIGSTADGSGNFVSAGGKPLEGTVDDVRIYDRALSASEILQMFQRGSDTSVAEISSSNLMGWWKLDESSGDAADSSGNSRTMTNVGTVTYSTGIIPSASTSLSPSASSSRSVSPSSSFSASRSPSSSFSASISPSASVSRSVSPSASSSTSTSPSASISPSQPPFGAVLKRWTGTQWVKAKLMTYTGSWENLPLAYWDGVEWVSVDVSG